MSTQRLRVISETSPTAPVRSRSLRRMLWLGSGASFALAIVAFVVVTSRIVSITDARDAERSRYARAAVAHKDRLAALYELHIANRARI